MNLSLGVGHVLNEDSHEVGPEKSLNQSVSMLGFRVPYFHIICQEFPQAEPEVQELELRVALEVPVDIFVENVFLEEASDKLSAQPGLVLG